MCSSVFYLIKLAYDSTFVKIMSIKQLLIIIIIASEEVIL